MSHAANSVQQFSLDGNFQSVFDTWKARVEKDQGILEITHEEILHDGKELLVFWRVAASVAQNTMDAQDAAFDKIMREIFSTRAEDRITPLTAEDVEEVFDRHLCANRARELANKARECVIEAYHTGVRHGRHAAPDKLCTLEPVNDET
jgi:hypothetical protein